MARFLKSSGGTPGPIDPGVRVGCGGYLAGGFAAGVATGGFAVIFRFPRSFWRSFFERAST